MRARGDGRIVHIASQAGVSLTAITGPSYLAGKHAVVALSRSLNAEEGIHGIRSICLSPGEVETPILNTRPVPPTAEERALMLQPEDVAEVALFCATLPRALCHRARPPPHRRPPRPRPGPRRSARLCLRHSQNPSGQIEGPR